MYILCDRVMDVGSAKPVPCIGSTQSRIMSNKCRNRRHTHQLVTIQIIGSHKLNMLMRFLAGYVFCCCQGHSKPSFVEDRDCNSSLLSVKFNYQKSALSRSHCGWKKNKQPGLAENLLNVVY